MTKTTAANGKQAAYFGVPAEDERLCTGDQDRKHDPCVRQLSQDNKGTLIAPAALDESGKPADFS